MIARSPEHTSDVVALTLPGLPGHDSNLEAMIGAWSLRTERIAILALLGPVEYVGQHKVPIFRVTTFGAIEGISGARRVGLQRDMFMVGRLDVRDMREIDPWQGIGAARSRVRTTLRRARNTAAKVDAAIPAWNAHVAKRAREAEERRLAEERARIEAEPVDEDLAFFTG